MKQPVCKVCGHPLTCPSCSGRQGGAASSEKKAEAVKRNLEKARANRWPKRTP